MDHSYLTKNIQANLLDWFIQNGRHWIPWKLREDGSSPDVGEKLSPYGIWIAEVMLQQTQLKVVIPYWKSWMKHFPDLKSLAEAEEKDLLLQWQGLGYYSRAKRISLASKILIQIVGIHKILDYDFWPVEIDQWMSLPGIGRSTAGSIISSAYDLPAPILDGNVKRILSRLIASKKELDKNQKRLWELSSLLISTKNPRNFNQALMDLGAKVCTTKKPNCCLCPLQNLCLAYLHYYQHALTAKSVIKHPI